MTISEVVEREILESLLYATRTVLRLIHDCGDHEVDGASPVSTREITWQTGLKNDTIRYHINRLVDRGLVEIYPERVEVGRRSTRIGTLSRPPATPVRPSTSQSGQQVRILMGCYAPLI